MRVEEGRTRSRQKLGDDVNARNSASATVAGTAVAGFGVALIAADGLVALLSFLVTVSALALGLPALL